MTLTMIGIKIYTVIFKKLFYTTGHVVWSMDAKSFYAALFP